MRGSEYILAIIVILVVTYLIITPVYNGVANVFNDTTEALAVND